MEDIVTHLREINRRVNVVAHDFVHGFKNTAVTPILPVTHSIWCTLITGRLFVSILFRPRLRASNQQRSVRQKCLLLNYIFEDLQIFRIWIYHAWAIFSPSLLSALLPSAKISFLFIRWISSVNLPHSSLETATIHFVPLDILKVLQFCLGNIGG